MDKNTLIVEIARLRLLRSTNFWNDFLACANGVQEFGETKRYFFKHAQLGDAQEIRFFKQSKRVTVSISKTPLGPYSLPFPKKLKYQNPMELTEKTPCRNIETGTRLTTKRKYGSLWLCDVDGTSIRYTNGSQGPKTVLVKEINLQPI